MTPTNNKNKYRRNILSPIVLISLLSVILSGCWEVTTSEKSNPSNSSNQILKDDEQTPIVQDKDLSTSEKDSQLSSTSSEDKEDAEAVQSKSDTDNINENEEASISIQNNMPVFYDTDNWDTSEVEALDISLVGQTPNELAKVISTDENSLDFASHTAIKYRFMENDAPYFDLVDSDEFLEVGWYYANANDTDGEKKTSISHAKKAHRFARQLMGEEGGELVANILEGQVISNQVISGVTVELAKCEFYSCMLVFKKDKTIPTIASDAAQLSNTDNTEINH